MVRHIVIWDLLEDMTESEKIEACLEIKRLLEPIKDVCEGVIKISVITEKLDSSNSELMLDSTFEDEEALERYKVHPAHVEAGKYVRSVVSKRSCIDWVED